MRVSFLLLTTSLFCGPALLTAVADDLDDAFQRLKEAQTKNDAAAVKKEAAQVHALAGPLIATPAPGDPEAKEAWASRVEYAKSADLFGEFALVATAAQAEPAVLVDMISTLEQQNPKSRYLDEIYGGYLFALSKTGAAAKIPAIAEKGLTNFPENEDLLLVMFDHVSSRNQADRAVGYANRLIAVFNKHPKPANVSAAEWERKKTLALGRSYVLVGATNAEKRQYVVADRNLRAALSYIKGNPTLLAPALFHLGMVNYQLGLQTMNKGLVREAAGFSEQCAVLDSPYADQARHNALVMKQEAQKMR